MEELSVVYLSERESKEFIDTSDTSKCGEVFRSTSGKYSLCCSHCNHSFSCLTEFSRHIEEHFQLISIGTVSDPGVTSDANNLKIGILKPIGIKEEPHFHISEIKVEFNDSHLMKKGARKKVKDPEEKNDKSTNLKVNKTIKGFKDPPNNIWICDICGKIFSTKNHIYQHMKLHRKAPKEHKCYLCGWEFYEKGNLTRHLRTHNNDPKAFKCETCHKGTYTIIVCFLDKKIYFVSKGFAQERYLSDHKKIHFPDTSFLCAICGRSFTSSSLLMRHNIVHSGEKKYSCEVCNRAFSRSDKVWSIC